MNLDPVSTRFFITPAARAALRARAGRPGGPVLRLTAESAGCCGMRVTVAPAAPAPGDDLAWCDGPLQVWVQDFVADEVERIGRITLDYVDLRFYGPAFVVELGDAAACAAG